MNVQIIKEVVKWVLSLAIIMTPFSVPDAKPQLYFDDSDADLMVLGNQFYEVGFLKSNGAIAYLIDQTTGRSVTEGSRKGCLWRVLFEHSPAKTPNRCEAWADEGRFYYVWSAETQALTLYYELDEGIKGIKEPVQAQVEVRASEASWFEMQLELELQLQSLTGEVIEGVDFPADLLFDEVEIQQVILPMLPGVALNSSFFEENRRYVSTYPAPFFADYLAVSSNLGEFALYSLHQDTIEPIQPVSLGVVHDKASQEQQMYLTHAFHTDIREGQRWQSPLVRIDVSKSPRDSIAAYRKANKLHKYPSLRDKVGSQYESLAQAPLLKADSSTLYRQLKAGFADYREKIFEKLPSPAIFHLVAYWEGQFDQNYPDFWPPNATYGSRTDFMAMIEEAQAMGFLVMPYTNPTWWNEESPTLQDLPASLTIDELVVQDKEREVVIKSYGTRQGVVTSPYVPFVQERVADVIEQLTIEVPSDLLFEDQIGARPWLFDYNVYSPATTSYSEGWLAHTRLYQDRKLMTEGGYDRLAETLVGFHGGLLLREQEGNAEKWWGEGTWQPYPLATMMVRDKVFFYQHNLDSKTMTKDKATLRWNLALGYMLSHNLSQNKYGGGLTNPWLSVVTSFQKEVLSHYANELLLDFTYLNEQVTKTSFETFDVIANWDAEHPYRIGPHTLSPAGVMSRQQNGQLTAGVFTYYNNARLSDGDHYLIEERHSEQIIIRQPMGAKTPLSLEPLATWSTQNEVSAWAYEQNGKQIAEVAIISQNQQYVTFEYNPIVNGQKVAYVMLSEGE